MDHLRYDPSREQLKTLQLVSILPFLIENLLLSSIVQNRCSRLPAVNYFFNCRGYSFHYNHSWSLKVSIFIIAQQFLLQSRKKKNSNSHLEHLLKLMAAQRYLPQAFTSHLINQLHRILKSMESKFSSLS